LHLLAASLPLAPALAAAAQPEQTLVAAAAQPERAPVVVEQELVLFPLEVVEVLPPEVFQQGI
jgi:hypothetical protein